MSEVMIQCPVLESTENVAPLNDEEIKAILDKKIEGVYEEADGLRFSTLKRYVENPWYHDNYDDEKEESASMELGTAFHSYLLEREKFLDTYREFVPPINKSTGKPYLSGKAYNDALQEFLASGFKPIEKDNLESFKIMEASAQMSGFLKYLEDGYVELPLQCDVEGYSEKCKIDFLSKEYGIIDIKTTSRNISTTMVEDNYRWEMRDRMYAEQLTYYLEIVKSIIGRNLQAHILLFETTKPFRVAHYSLTSLARERSLYSITDWKVKYFSKEKEYSVLNWEIM